ncbi:hypothetical protein SAMN05444172_2255 [Burkholderia sp. GAS332]|nr:hypothetical protein SAMN05444172_2255 [Burkholderia sp. GAS332]
MDGETAGRLCAGICLYEILMQRFLLWMALAAFVRESVSLRFLHGHRDAIHHPVEDCV